MAQKTDTNKATYRPDLTNVTALSRPLAGHVHSLLPAGHTWRRSATSRGPFGLFLRTSKPHSSQSKLTPTSAPVPASDLLLTLKMQRLMGVLEPQHLWLPKPRPTAPRGPPAAGASPSWEHSSRPGLRAPKLLPRSRTLRPLRAQPAGPGGICFLSTNLTFPEHSP